MAQTLSTQGVASPKPVSKATPSTRLVPKIRSELNIEKWPAIWQPAKSKNRPVLRTMERETVTPDGNRVVSRVEVGFTQLGTLTTEEQKTLYVLIQLWEDSGKPDVQVFFSTRAVARMLKKKGWGTNVIQAITKSLRKLRTIPIEWINSYYDKTAEGAVVVDHRPFTILGDLRIVERRQDGAVNSSLGYFKFDDHILSNLQLNYTKPVCIEEFFKLKSEIAQLIYTHIDLMLCDKTKYERKSKELFDDLGLKNAEYTHMYERKRALERAVSELEGIRLSTGTLRSAAVEKTKDGKDYKVSFQKVTRADAVFDLLPEPAPVVVNDYSKQKNPLTLQAEELVRHFHRVFHRVDTHVPQSKETGQALSLISQHGFKEAQHVIEFARAEAEKTNFQIQHFGAVLSYTSRALSDLMRTAAQATNGKTKREAAAPEKPDALLVRGERRLAALIPEQLQARLQNAQAEFRKENSFLSRHWKEGNQTQDKMLRARVIRELGAEPMELMPMACMPEWARNLAQNLPL
jgi:hypothetical protein